MGSRLSAAGFALSLVFLAALPAAAQRRPVASVRSPSTAPQVGVTGQVFVPGFGFRPIIQERDTGGVFHHRRGFHTGFGFRHSLGGFFGGFNGRNFFGFASVPFYSAYSYPTAPTVIVIEQPAPTQVVERIIVDESRGAVVVAGLPDNWSELRGAELELRRPLAPAGTALTLLALRDGTLFSVTDYWLEDRLVFYVTTTGRQGSVPLRLLDWETTTRLNAERGVEFVLRVPR